MYAIEAEGLVKHFGDTAALDGVDLAVPAEATAVRSLIGLTGQYASVDEELSGLGDLVLIRRLLRLPGTSVRRAGRAGPPAPRPRRAGRRRRGRGAPRARAG